MRESSVELPAWAIGSYLESLGISGNANELLQLELIKLPKDDAHMVKRVLLIKKMLLYIFRLSSRLDDLRRDQVAEALSYVSYALGGQENHCCTGKLIRFILSFQK